MQNEKISHILANLRDEVIRINNGFYPKDILQDLGRFGLYESFYVKKEQGLFEAVESIAKVSKICGNTGFCVWCQEVLIWYLFNSFHSNESLLKQASYGYILGGTGLSNPIKSFANIEKIKLYAKKVYGGYVINGSLPWVSNIDYGHIFGIIAKVESNDVNSSDFIMGLVKCQKDTLELKDEINFCALEGSATKSVILKDYFLSEDFIISDPASALLPQIMPGFVLLQAGIALGLCECGIDMLNRAKNDINTFLPKNVEYFKNAKNTLINRTKKACKTPFNTSKEFFYSVLKLKHDFVNLTLEIASYAIMALGTKGYLKDSLASKLLIESHFIAIVTPSIKHISKILQH